MSKVSKPWILIVPPDASVNDIPPGLVHLLPGNSGMLVLPWELWDIIAGNMFKDEAPTLLGRSK